MSARDGISYHLSYEIVLCLCSTLKLVHFSDSYVFQVFHTGRHLYAHTDWNYSIRTIIFVFTGTGVLIIAQMITQLCASIRDFIMCQFDKSRTEDSRRKLRTQKRLARRQLLHEFRDTKGKTINIKHLTKSQVEYINEHGVEYGTAKEAIEGAFIPGVSPADVKVYHANPNHKHEEVNINDKAYEPKFVHVNKIYGDRRVLKKEQNELEKQDF